MVEKGYKVVEVDPDGRLFSCGGFGTWDSDRALRVEYGVGMLSLPRYRCGPLAVFSDLRSALSYRFWTPSSEVYECEYEPSSEHVVHRDQPSITEPGTMTHISEQLWVLTRTWGAVALAKSVTLIRPMRGMAGVP